MSAVASGIGGCLNTGGGSSGTLKIGATFPTSGPYSSAGQAMINAMEMAIEEFDGEVGGREVESLVRDSGTSPDKAIPAVETLISDEEIEMLFGGFSSSVIIPQSETANRNEIPYLPPGGSTLSLTGENCKKGYFGVTPSNVQYSGVMIMAARAGLMDSMYMVVPDYEGGYSARDAFNSVIPRETDVDILGSTTAPLGADDFSAQISEVRDSGADLVLMIGIGGDAITFVTQAVNAGLNEEMELAMMLAGQSVAQGIPDEVIGEIHAGTPFYWQADGSREFSDAFETEYGNKPNWWTAHSYTATMEGLTAIDENDGSAEIPDVASFLEDRSFEWTRPNMKWRACDHRAIQPYYLVKGVSPEDRDQEAAYWDVVGEVGDEQIMRSCEETNCTF
jgi:branched-chain amino acid transport system substrate-binding protein